MVLMDGNNAATARSHSVTCHYANDIYMVKAVAGVKPNVGLPFRKTAGRESDWKTHHR
jgi:hypothetical protein